MSATSSNNFDSDKVDEAWRVIQILRLQQNGPLQFKEIDLKKNDIKLSPEFEAWFKKIEDNATRFLDEWEEKQDLIDFLHKINHEQEHIQEKEEIVGILKTAKNDKKRKLGEDQTLRIRAVRKAKKVGSNDAMNLRAIFKKLTPTEFKLPEHIATTPQAETEEIVGILKTAKNDKKRKLDEDQTSSIKAVKKAKIEVGSNDATNLQAIFKNLAPTEFKLPEQNATTP